MTAGFILAIDQGTTSTRAIVFGADGLPVASAQEELAQIYPKPGWVEHDAEEIWRAVQAVSRRACETAGAGPAAIAAIGITNQRETSLIWDRRTGEPIHNAIVWQDRRTADACARLKADGHEATVQDRTGLLLDPYFSASKIAWMLDNVDGARARAAAGELAFGTIDTFLLWRLTGGAAHATDASNAARTMLFDIHKQDWDDALCELFGVPRAMLPRVRDNAADFGTTTADFLGAPVAIRGMAGDQQAAAFGQCCFAPGMIKSTYGTGCFALINTGATAIRSRNKLLTTVAWRLAGEVTYAIEGSIFIAGAAVQWLRDGLGLIKSAAETQALAGAANPAAAVYLVPAFAGLGAPWWDARARGAILGLTRDTGAPEIARAALEAVGYQTRDLFEAMAADGAAGGAAKGAADGVAKGAARPAALRVDGGMVANDWLMQFLADILDVPVDRPQIPETTALGAASLAGMQAGIWPGPEGLAKRWRLDKRFEPTMAEAEREARYAGWLEAVGRVRS